MGNKTGTLNNLEDTSLNIYYKDVEETSMLTAEKERELIILYHSTEDASKKRRAQKRIIEGALRYVIAEARKHPRSLKDQTVLEDLIAAGNIGLVRALDKFDPSCGTRFLTYAGWWVRHEMREEARKIGLLHIPAHALAKGVKNPSTVELTEHLTPEGEEDSKSNTENIEVQQSLVKLLSLTQLTTREVFIIKACYGVHTPPKTLKQIGRILGITGERVRQLREAALQRLRQTAHQNMITMT